MPLWNSSKKLPIEHLQGVFMNDHFQRKSSVFHDFTMEGTHLFQNYIGTNFIHSLQSLLLAVGGRTISYLEV